jgi:hypothetical protein
MLRNRKSFSQVLEEKARPAGHKKQTRIQSPSSSGVPKNEEPTQARVLFCFTSRRVRFFHVGSYARSI